MNFIEFRHFTYQCMGVQHLWTFYFVAVGFSLKLTRVRLFNGCNHLKWRSRKSRGHKSLVSNRAAKRAQGKRSPVNPACTSHPNGLGEMIRILVKHHHQTCQTRNKSIQQQPVALFSVRAFCAISSSSSPLKVYFVWEKTSVFVQHAQNNVENGFCCWKQYMSLEFSSNFGREVYEI